MVSCSDGPVTFIKELFKKKNQVISRPIQRTEVLSTDGQENEILDPFLLHADDEKTSGCSCNSVQVLNDVRVTFFKESIEILKRLNPWLEHAVNWNIYVAEKGIHRTAIFVPILDELTMNVKTDFREDILSDSSQKKIEVEGMHSIQQVECSTLHCARPSWNGQFGEKCCRTCSKGGGHGPRCEIKYAQSMTTLQLNNFNLLFHMGNNDTSFYPLFELHPRFNLNSNALFYYGICNKTISEIAISSVGIVEKYFRDNERGLLSGNCHTYVSELITKSGCYCK